MTIIAIANGAPRAEVVEAINAVIDTGLGPGAGAEIETWREVRLALEPIADGFDLETFDDQEQLLLVRERINAIIETINDAE